MLDLIEKNKEMLKNNLYNSTDTRQMLKIDSLTNINDYDLYLIACCLCNYDIEEKSEARDLRMEYFLKTNNGNISGYEHNISDYKNTSKTNITCKNTGNINKYGLYEFEINTVDKEIINILWSKKSDDCLKYVDSKTYPDKIIVSINKGQFDNFTNLLDELLINYDIDNLSIGLIFNNNSNNTLIDTSTLDLPFEPYPYQLEDAQKIVKKKRALLGHEMGCGKTFISILVGSSIFNKEDVIYRALDNLEYNDIVITDKGPLPIGKIVEENIDCKVQVIKNGITKFVNILDRRCVEE